MHGGMWGSGGNAGLNDRWWKCVLEWRFGFLPLEVLDILDSSKMSRVHQASNQRRGLMSDRSVDGVDNYPRENGDAGRSGYLCDYDRGYFPNRAKPWPPPV